MSSKNFTFRYFIGETEITEDPAERSELGARLTERMGAALTDWFSTHPEEYKSI